MVVQTQKTGEVGATPSGQPAGQASPGAAKASPPSGDHQAQFTPGPWRADAIGNVWAEDTKIVDMSAEPEQWRAFRPKRAGEHAANRLLIAAAPDLYGVLSEAHEAWKSMPKVSADIPEAAVPFIMWLSDTMVPILMERAPVVLAKARGES